MNIFSDIYVLKNVLVGAFFLFLFTMVMFNIGLHLDWKENYPKKIIVSFQMILLSMVVGVILLISVVSLISVVWGKAEIILWFGTTLLFFIGNIFFLFSKRKLYRDSKRKEKIQQDFRTILDIDEL